jgi:hypothetical protein
MTDIEKDIENLKAAFPHADALHDDLQDRVVEGGPFGRMIHHPLCVEIVVAPEMFGMVNQRYVWKTERLTEAVDQGDWHTYVFLHERPYRADALRDVPPTWEGFWSLVADVWTDSENIWQNHDSWQKIWQGFQQEDRAALLDADNLAAYHALPEFVTVYRGYNQDNARGWSWTTDHEQASWFARRWQKGRPKVATGTITKRDVIAVFLDRGENEIVADPANVVLGAIRTAR